MFPTLLRNCLSPHLRCTLHPLGAPHPFPACCRSRLGIRYCPRIPRRQCLCNIRQTGYPHFLSRYACTATVSTIISKRKPRIPQGVFLGAINADIYSPLRMREVDVFVFNPPYVPTPELPTLHGLAQLTGFEAETRYLHHL